MSNININLLNRRINEVLSMFETCEETIYSILLLLSSVRGVIDFKYKTKVDNYVVNVINFLCKPLEYYCIRVQPDCEKPLYYFFINVPMYRTNENKLLFAMIDRFINLIKNPYCIVQQVEFVRKAHCFEEHIKLDDVLTLKISFGFNGVYIFLYDKNLSVDSFHVGFYVCLKEVE